MPRYPMKERNDILASFAGGGVLLLLAIWGIICVLSRGDTIRRNPMWRGDGGRPVGWTVAFIVAVFGVALVWRGVDRWRALLRSSHVPDSGSDQRAPPNGGPGLPPGNSDSSEGPPSVS